MPPVYEDEPNMSDATLLVSVEDLINMAMGPTEKNKVNFKLIQTVLLILARQMRMLEQRVEIRIAHEKEHDTSPKRKRDDIKEERKSRSPKRLSKEAAAKQEIEKVEKAALQKREKEERAAIKDREKADRAVSKEREKAEKAAAKEREKEERAASKEREKAERAESKEREKAERAASKEREKAEKAAAKERDKAERAASKERDKAESKERDKAERAASKEREKAEKAAAKDRDKAERAASKEREKQERDASKEREKAEKAAAKDRDKADRAASKEREKAEKSALKDKEKAEREAEKERAKAEKEAAKEERAASKEREKAEKAAEKGEKAAMKEKEKADKAAAKEKEKEEKMAAKEKPKAEKDTAKQGNIKSKDKKGKALSDTSIVVSEVERRKEKVLVVEKGPTTRPDARREGIEVVTRSQFDIVQAMVNELAKRASPLPPPALPDNQKLRDDLARGSASLTDTMQAMQVTARVRAAENAISRMGEMLTALAAAGALPEEFTMQEIKFEPLPEVQPPDAEAQDDAAAEPTAVKSQAAALRKSVAIDPLAIPSQSEQKSRPSTAATGRPSMARASVTSRQSTAGGAARPSTVSGASAIVEAGVTHPEMDSAIRGLRDEMTKAVQNMTKKATAVAETAAASAKSVAEKLEIALTLDNRISTLYSLVSDYAEQLSGFDTGLTTQMSSFRDQMTQMKADLDAGLKQLEKVNSNAETAAVMELKERYDGLVSEFEHTLNSHRALTGFQDQLGNEAHSLVECVEMLREQKADRDEVLDGLRDKADNSRLAGLLTVMEFNMARSELDKRLDVCHDKFRRQEAVWMTALKELTHVTESKAEITQLLAAREAAELMLLQLQDKQNKLAVILGEPKAAMLTRELSRGGVCGACLAPALMEPVDASCGAPPPLPAMRPRTIGAEEPCVPEWKPPEPPDDRDHTCHRWCGGSHTLLSEAVTRERAPPVLVDGVPTKRYVGYGSDGRLYMMEDELQPCAECNKVSEKMQEGDAPAPPAGGAGDQGPALATTETV